jgi:hypothetical protein
MLFPFLPANTRLTGNILILCIKKWLAGSVLPPACSACNSTIKVQKELQSEFSFSLYNAHGRENAYSVSFRDSELEPGKNRNGSNVTF